MIKLKVHPTNSVFNLTIGERLNEKTKNCYIVVSQWKRKRRQIAPLFSANSVENYLHIFNRHASELSQKLRPYCDTDESFDLWNSISKTALSTIFGKNNRIIMKKILAQQAQPQVFE